MESDVLGPLEQRVMSHLWRMGASTVAEVQHALNDGSSAVLAYTTVMTILSRLFEKEFVTRTKEGRGFRYDTAVDEASLRDVAARRELQHVVDRYGGETLAAFAADLAKTDPELAGRVRELAQRSPEIRKP